MTLDEYFDINPGRQTTFADIYIRYYSNRLKKQGVDLDKKQLRYSDIIRVARKFYPNLIEGIRELVDSCNKNNSSIYSKVSMWESLETNYQWMITKC